MSERRRTLVLEQIPERPILFSGAMVRAILEGRKTQTRRIVKFLPEYLDAQFVRIKHEARKNRFDPVLSIKHPDAYAACPYGQIGDRLWVRESFFETGITNVIVSSRHRFYKASYEGDLPIKWKPSIHMPRFMSRITLEITNVRVERLQDISEEDAKTEGLETNDHFFCGRHGRNDIYPTAKQAFADLWDKINGKRASWESNPWVWVVEFKKL